MVLFPYARFQKDTGILIEDTFILIGTLCILRIPFRAVPVLSCQRGSYILCKSVADGPWLDDFP